MQFDRNRLTLALAIGLGLACPSFAQEAQAPVAPQAPAATAPAAPAPAPTTPPAPAPAPATPAPAPAPTAAAPAPATTAPATDGNPARPEVTEFVRDTFGDWQVRCLSKSDECFMYQLALDTNKNPVAEVSLLKLPAGGEAAAGMTIVSPLGTLLTTGVQIQIDTNEPRQYPFNWCSQAGCFSRFGLLPDSVAAMKRGKKGTMTLIAVASPQSPIALNLSLTGFTAAYDSLKTPPAPPGMAVQAPAAPAPKPLPSLMPKN